MRIRVKWGLFGVPAGVCVCVCVYIYTRALVCTLEAEIVRPQQPCQGAVSQSPVQLKQVIVTVSS